MAPSGTPGRRKRENNYFDVGIKGRKTGITLKDTGLRDEHGMEPLDGVFSSPEKSPEKRNSGSRRVDVTITTSEDMDIVDSSLPGPTRTRKSLRSDKPYLPPPMARSPIKTALGSSPRRQSMGPPSQARRPVIALESLDSPGVNRRLNFSTRRSGRGKLAESPAAVNGQGNESGDIYDLKPSPERGQKRSYDESINDIGDEAEAGVDIIPNGAQEDSYIPGAPDESPPEMVIGVDESTIEPSQIADRTPKKPNRGGRRTGAGRKRNSGGPAKKGGSRLSTGRRKREPDLEEESQDVTPDDKEVAEAQAEVPEEAEDSAVLAETLPQLVKNRGRKKAGPVKLIAKPADTSILDDSSVMPPPKRRGRPPKSLQVHKDDTAVARPAKRSRITASAPREQDPNIRASPARSTIDSILDRKPGPRSLQILRQGTPMEDDGAYRTRAGRSSVKPIDRWRGESVDYGNDGSIRAIIRAEDITPIKKVLPRNRRQASRTAQRMEDIDEEDDEEEPWESAARGIKTGYVNLWDNVLQSTAEESELQEIAFAPSAIQTRDVANAEFRYAKIIGQPFFSVGMVDLPAQGYKRQKNSRRMHMSFFVFKGKVTVTVGDNEFVVRKGGVWQVPRGNFYSIENPTDRDARVFFAQGCELEAGLASD